jgi:alanyl-tRNA synthetase
MTGQIGVYVTTQETSSAAGIRRIEALTGRGAEGYLMNRKRAVDTLASRLQTSPDMVEQRVDHLMADLSAARKELERLHRTAAQGLALQLAETALDLQGNSVVAAYVTAPDLDTLRAMNDSIRDHLRGLQRDRIAILLAATLDDRATFIVTVSPQLVAQGVHAGKIAQTVGERLGGKGGGRPESAQGGGRSVERLATVVAEIPDLIAEQLKASSSSKH